MTEESKSVQANNNPIRRPLFRKTTFENLNGTFGNGHANGKRATVSVRISHVDSLIYVEKQNGSNEVVGFQNPETGYFVTNIHQGGPSAKNTHNEFRKLAVEYAEDAVDRKIEELRQLHDEDKNKYASLYKPLPQIVSELSSYLDDRTDFYIDLDKQINVLHSNALPNVNEYVAFEGEDIAPNKYVTTSVNYFDPQEQELTDDQRRVVDHLLDVFVSDENKQILSWYFGAMLCNLPVGNNNISRLLIVTSARGGSGKSTLMSGLVNALLGDQYSDIKSNFDDVFSRNNRFGASQINPVRFIMYNEAEFNDGSSELHDFTGLNVSDIKTLTTDGQYGYERKYAQKTTGSIHSFQAILTNHAPELANTSTASALSRRLIAVFVNSSSMAKKGRILGLTSEHSIAEYIQQHVQAFANYFVDYYKHHETQWREVDYTYQDIDEAISDATDALLSEATAKPGALKATRYDSVIRTIAKEELYDETAIDNFLKYLEAAAHDDKDNAVRLDDGNIYIDSRKGFFADHGVGALRDKINTIFRPEKKFSTRRFKLKYK